MTRDEDLLEALFRDPECGWATFWRAYQPVVVSVINCFHLPKEDADDILQDVSEHICVNHFQVLRSWDSHRSPLGIFLAVITKHRVFDFLRSPFFKYSQRKVEGIETEEGLEPVDLLEDPSDDPAKFVHRIQVMETLNTTLDDLAARNQISHEDRIMVGMLAFGADYAEIAQVLGISRENAMTRFCRIKSRLRLHLENRGIVGADAGE